MEIKHREDSSRRYVVIRKAQEEKSGFQEKMIIKNTIPGLLKTSIQHLNGETYYYYDTRSKQDIKSMFDGNPMGAKPMEEFILSIKEISKELDRYLLRLSDLIMLPECIFWNTDLNRPEFCYYPDNAESEEEWNTFGQFLLDNVDEKDEAASKLAYDYFQLISEGMYIPESLIKKEREPEIREKEEKPFEEEEILPLNKLWTEVENKDSFFEFEDKGKGLKAEEAPKSKKKAVIFSIEAGAVIVLLAGFLFMHPELLSGLGFSEEDLFTVVLGLTLLLSAGGVLLWKISMGRGKGEIEEEEKPSDYLADKINFQRDSLEEEQYEAESGLREAGSGFLGTKGRFTRAKSDLTEARDGLAESEGHFTAARSSTEEAEVRFAVSRSRHTETGYSFSETKNGFQETAGKRNVNTEEHDPDIYSETTVLTSFDGLSTAQRGKRPPLLIGKLNGKSLCFRIDKTPFMIGKFKGKADALLQDERVSRIHACIRKEDNKYYLSDLNSTNGTCLNDRRLELEETAELHDGDLIKFANVLMRYSEDS